MIRTKEIQLIVIILLLGTTAYPQTFKGAIIRGDTLKKQLAIVFTGDRTGDGGEVIARTLRKKGVKASFFLTGRFYQDPAFKKLLFQLKKDGHYLGAHSDQHLLYNDWNNRDSLLVTKEQFTSDLLHNYKRMDSFGIRKQDAYYFMPPFEWYNDSIAVWTKELGLQLINFTSGTLSAADYTAPDMKNYRSTDTIYQSILRYESSYSYGLNGFILLLHIGTNPRRTDKFYHRLSELIETLSRKGYKMVRIDQLLSGH